MNTAKEFDKHADTYDAELNNALSVSGESKEYFARQRVRWLERCLRQLREQPEHALDYGCGIGDTSVLLSRIFNPKFVIGLDVSSRSLELARLRHTSGPCRFLGFQDYVPQEDIDLVYCNGTFHHIPVAKRADCIDYVRRCLRPGGLFSLWENNPWNPGTRIIMSRCSFDRDAITLPPPESARLVRAGGFEIVRVDYLFFFPHLLKVFRFLEPYFSRVPLGAQYQMLCRKPFA